MNKYVKCYLCELCMECTDWPQCFIAISCAAAALFIDECYRGLIKGTEFFFIVKETNLSTTRSLRCPSVENKRLLKYKKIIEFCFKDYDSSLMKLSKKSGNVARLLRVCQ